MVRLSFICDIALSKTREPSPRQINSLWPEAAALRPQGSQTCLSCVAVLSMWFPSHGLGVCVCVCGHVCGRVCIQVDTLCVGVHMHVETEAGVEALSWLLLYLTERT